MPANPNHKQITSWVTPAQLAALKEAVASSQLNQSEYVRQAIGAMVEAAGIFWPDDMPGKGKYERKPPE